MESILVGEQLYDQNRCDELFNSITAKISSGVTSVVLDMSECRALSAYGLNTLVDASEQLNGALELKNVNRELRELMAMTFLDLKLRFS